MEVNIGGRPEKCIVLRRTASSFRCHRVCLAEDSKSKKRSGSDKFIATAPKTEMLDIIISSQSEIAVSNVI